MESLRSPGRETMMRGFTLLEFLVATSFFLILLLAGFFYIWKKGVLDWGGAESDQV